LDRIFFASKFCLFASEFCLFASYSWLLICALKKIIVPILKIIAGQNNPRALKKLFRPKKHFPAG